jgi:hypothetical protein
VFFSFPPRSDSKLSSIRDLAESFTHGELKGYFQAPWIEQIIKQGKSARGANASIREVCSSDGVNPPK